MANTVWDLRLYNLDGDPVTAAAYSGTEFSSSNHIRFATDLQLQYNLNTFDQLDFSLWLDDPMAKKISRGKSVVKLWRSIVDPTLPAPLVEDNPAFCGLVGRTGKSGQDNKMTITAYNPLWRLQFHFHLLNHYLETNLDTNDLYTQSELMWKLIDLIQEAFPGGQSYLGMEKGAFLYGAGEPQPVPYFVPKGSNTWSNIFDDLMNRPSSPDIIPGYIHADHNPVLMDFNTDRKRGTDRTPGSMEPFAFNYHTTAASGYPPNCEDMVEDIALQPGEWGNYLWVVGSGGPNSGRIAARENASGVSDSDGVNELGVYMVRVDRDEVKQFSALSGTNNIPDAEFDKRKHPIGSYSVTLSPVANIYYHYHFELGDVVTLNADRGALQLTDEVQRIYQVTLKQSINNVETCDVLVAKDFYGKVDGS